MSTELLKSSILAQFEASLAMLRICLEKCPPEHWDGIIGKYPFWQVAYHTLCFADCYCAVRDEEWLPRQGGTGLTGDLHPKGRTELEEEYPSRRFSKEELVAYCELCLEIVRTAMARETEATLAGESGFSWLKMPRAEVYIYNLRHIQHHAGQLSALLRRTGVETTRHGWVGRGWR
jgi:hypothetical protein